MELQIAWPPHTTARVPVACVSGSRRRRRPSMLRITQLKSTLYNCVQLNSIISSFNVETIIILSPPRIGGEPHKPYYAISTTHTTLHPHTHYTAKFAYITVCIGAEYTWHLCVCVNVLRWRAPLEPPSKSTRARVHGLVRTISQ